MTEQEIRIAIAEFCGWKNIELKIINKHYFADGEEVLEGTAPNKNPFCRVPDYPNDLNAMHEAETYAITHHPEFDIYYWIKLAHVTKCYRTDGKEIGYASAHQRAVAMCRTIGKWKD